MSDAQAMYDALLSSPGHLRGLRRLQYRCIERCLLLDAIETPHGVLLHQNRYKYSTQENLNRSNDAGRRANTYDGANHWHEQTFYLEQSALAYPDDQPLPALSMQCDHVLAHQLRAAAFRNDWAEGRAEIIVRPNNSQYAK